MIILFTEWHLCVLGNEQAVTGHDKLGHLHVGYLNLTCIATVLLTT